MNLKPEQNPAMPISVALAFYYRNMLEKSWLNQTFGRKSIFRIREKSLSPSKAEKTH